MKSPPKNPPTPGIYADLDNPSLPNEKLKKFASYIGDIYTKTDRFDNNKVTLVMFYLFFFYLHSSLQVTIEKIKKAGFFPKTTAPKISVDKKVLHFLKVRFFE